MAMTFSEPRSALSAAIASACSCVLASSLLSFLKPRSSSSSGVRLSTTLGSSSRPASAAAARSSTSRLDRLARQLAAQARRQRAPLRVVEVRARGRPVEVLQRAADGLGAHELDAVVVAQHPYVVGDDAERGAELDGEIARAGDALAQALQDARAQRVRERLGDSGL